MKTEEQIKEKLEYIKGLYVKDKIDEIRFNAFNYILTWVLENEI